MPRPLRRDGSLLLSLVEMLNLVGISDRKWRELLATEELQRHQGRRIASPMPRPVKLTGRPMYRRGDVLRWVDDIGTDAA